jgi:CelD/BcsL family acetyltransferase involved in cellulose biosynthesis
MQISLINNLQQFDSLKEAWETSYAADQNASICVSWPWLRGWFEVTPYSWFVLAVRQNSHSPFIGFLPLSMDSKNLLMGGTPLADYTGFVCPPEHESRAIKTWAEYIVKNLKWEVFHLTNVMDSRINVFLQHFGSQKFIQEQKKLRSCPYISLPGDWDQYLSECIGKKTSRDIRRSLKKIAESLDFKITHAEEHSLDSHVETLLNHWHARWGLQDCYKEGFRKVFHQCFKKGVLWLSILWDGAKPIGLLAGFFDRPKKTFTACITSSDLSYAQLRPGKTIYAYSIKYAIDHGCKVYDFTQGNEMYKFSFGAVERFSPSIILTRKAHKTVRLILKKVREKLRNIKKLGVAYK